MPTVHLIFKIHFTSTSSAFQNFANICAKHQRATHNMNIDSREIKICKIYIVVKPFLQYYFTYDADVCDNLEDSLDYKK